MTLARRSFGSHDLTVSILGFGGGPIGDPALPDARAREVLLAAIDCGITLFDTARSYGVSEDRIGRHLERHRDDIVLSTKLGYGVDGIPDWTGPCVRAGVEAARRRLRTDVIDIVHLHSCPRAVLEAGEVVDALAAEVAAGHVRVAAYAGDNDALAWAFDDPRIGAVQTSVNVCDRWSLRHAIVHRGGRGVIAKRALANACWSHRERPRADDVALYWDRWQTLAIATELDADELCLRYCAFAPGVDAAIVGTTDVDHLRRNVALARRGPLPASMLASLEHAYDERGRAWAGMI